MPYNSILREVERLKRLSGRLDVLADEHLSLTEALLPISASIMSLATVLEVLVISRAGAPPARPGVRGE